MRNAVLHNHIRGLSQASILTALALSFAGCSSDFTRFDDLLEASLPRSQQVNYTVPANVDPVTTASISRSAPSAPVYSQSDHAGYQPLQSYQAPKSPGVPQYLPSVAQGIAPVENRSLPLPQAKPEIDPIITGSTPAGQTSSDWKTTRQPLPARIGGQGPATQLASASFDRTPQSSGGWSRAGGTSIKVRPNETLYNIAKRYGVPVQAIMEVNGIRDANSVQAGQRIVVPTYVYSKSAPVSAPDNEPHTRSSRSSKGYHGQTFGKVAVPTHRPDGSYQANRNLLTVDGRDAGRRYSHPTRRPQYRPSASHIDPVVTSSVKPNSSQRATSGVYTVVSGDGLYGIARRHGTTVSAIMAANNLPNTHIRVGQKLILPGASGGYVAQTPVGKSVDKPLQGPKPYTKPAVDKTFTASVDPKAPQSSGISNFRWPVKGRIISGFGENRRTGVNDGIDISVPEGTAVRAAENGVVIYSGSDLEGFGNLVLIRHQGGLVTAYAHNKVNKVSKGSQVKRGQTIAISGRTGNATTPMLHFEVRKNAKPVNPHAYLSS